MYKIAMILVTDSQTCLYFIYYLHNNLTNKLNNFNRDGYLYNLEDVS